MIAAAVAVPVVLRQIGRIPVRNLWLLMLYASNLARIGKIGNSLTDEQIDDLPDLIAHLLADAVDFRYRRNLTRGYCLRQRVLTRVRGRIDNLKTETGLLLSRGEVFCSFEEQTVDTPRNRFVRAALERIARIVRATDLVHRCRSLALSLGRAGVQGLRPSRGDLARDRIERNDLADANMVALSELAFDLLLPTEEPGVKALSEPDREEAWVRRLFERAVLGFARVELEPLGWKVRGGVNLNWQVTRASDGIPAILPRMITDVVLDAPCEGGRVVVDTKFTSILGTRRFGNAGLKSGYLYQMYSYLRSQEGVEDAWTQASGLFVHPSIGVDLFERLTIQLHSITFATVDLSRPPRDIKRELRRILSFEVR